MNRQKINKLIIEISYILENNKKYIEKTNVYMNKAQFILKKDQNGNVVELPIGNVNHLNNENIVNIHYGEKT